MLNIDTPVNFLVYQPGAKEVPLAAHEMLHVAAFHLLTDLEFEVRAATGDHAELARYRARRMTGDPAVVRLIQSHAALLEKTLRDVTLRFTEGAGDE